MVRRGFSVPKTKLLVAGGMTSSEHVLLGTQMNSAAIDSRALSAKRACRAVLDAIPDAVLIFAPRSFQVLEANGKAAELYGYSRRELLTKELRDLTGGVASYPEYVYNSPSVEARHISRSGDGLDFLVSVSLIKYCGRRAILSINRDIRELKRTQAFIAANEKKFRLLLQNVSEIVALVDSSGAVRFISPQAERILGTAPSEVLGHEVFEFIHPEDIPRAREEYARTLSNAGEAVPSVLRFRDSTGGWTPFEIIANNLTDEPGIGGVVFTARDFRYRMEIEDVARSRAREEVNRRVEERTLELAQANAALRLENQRRRYTEKQLRESLSLLSATLESTADGILVVSTDGAIRSFNNKFVEMWRLAASTLEVATYEQLVKWVAPQLDHLEELLAGQKSLDAWGDTTGFDVLSLKDGRIFERYSQPQRVGNLVVGRVWSFRDVTQARWLQEEVQHGQKMEAIGRLAGGVAHDFNNVLMLMSGHVADLLEDEGLSETSRLLGVRLRSDIERASSLTRQLLAFSRKQPVTPETVDLNRIVGDMEKMLPRLLSDSVDLSVSRSPETLPILVDRSQIELVIINLAINARDAMPHGGTLSITTGSEELDDTDVSLAQEQKSYVVMQIRDTGHGMAPEVKAHIFEPFFTTKNFGKGTGLGLSTVYGIVEQAGGYVTFESEPGRGTTFRICFPKSVLARDGRPEPKQQIHTRGDETILLVEDEEGIRAMTKNYLERQGYEVLDAKDGPAAIRVSREYRKRIHLLVTDIHMPEMKGDELIRVIRQDRPEVLAMLVSGYVTDKERVLDVPILAKPYDFPKLGEKVREVLDAPSSKAKDSPMVA